MVFKFMLNRKNIIISLLCLEALIVINIVILMTMCETLVFMVSMCFILVAVVDACLGLASIIQLTRLFSPNSTPVMYAHKLIKLSAFKAENIISNGLV